MRAYYVYAGKKTVGANMLPEQAVKLGEKLVRAARRPKGRAISLVLWRESRKMDVIYGRNVESNARKRTEQESVRSVQRKGDLQ